MFSATVRPSTSATTPGKRFTMSAMPKRLEASLPAMRWEASAPFVRPSSKSIDYPSILRMSRHNEVSCASLPVVTSIGGVAPSGSSGAGELLRLMLDGTPRTRAELIKMTGLARSTVGARVDALLAAGLLTTSGEAASTGGGPPAPPPLHPGARGGTPARLGAPP